LLEYRAVIFGHEGAGVVVDVGRQPLYHVGIEELQDWTYAGERLVPLKGYPGVVWERPGRKKRRESCTSS
jgi:hypothetical protein